MVQQIAMAHGGEIRLDSDPGHGSTFTLLLPVRTAETVTQASVVHGPQHGPGRPEA
jgi:light-regulated signal transduction histidine kinase (bacteriophytochrome)